MKFTNPDKILYPENGITKANIAEYMLSIQDLILPYLQKRLLSVVKCPEGYKKDCFFQKHTGHNTKYVSYFNVNGTSGDEKYFYIRNASGLLYLAQMNVLEIHPWGSKITNLEKPDLIIFDLDPGPSVEWKTVVHLAHFIREELEKLNLVSFVKTTGGKGLHITIPIKPKHSWDEVKLFAKSFATYMTTLKPDICIDTMAKSKRRGKIFIDYLRNSRGATAIAPYSLRARKDAPIATPIDWSELSVKLRSDFYNIKNFSKRLQKLNTDPWEDFYKIKQNLKL